MGKQHPDGCTCEKCYRQWCKFHGFKPESKAHKLPDKPVVLYPASYP